MEPWAREYLEVFGSRIEHIAAMLFEGVERDPGSKGRYKLGDCVQMIRGVYVMMEEELEGRGADARDAFLNGVIPSMIAAGEKIAIIAAQTEAVVIRIHADIFQRISKENHREAEEFFIAWQTKYMYDIVAIALESGARG